MRIVTPHTLPAAERVALETLAELHLADSLPYARKAHTLARWGYARRLIGDQDYNRIIALDDFVIIRNGA